MTEKRKDDRYDLLMPVRLMPGIEVDKTDSTVAETLNISSAGALIKAATLLPVGTELEMELFLNVEKLLETIGEQQRVKVQLKGRVVRHLDNRMAVSFDNRYEFRRF